MAQQWLNDGVTIHQFTDSVSGMHIIFVMHAYLCHYEKTAQEILRKVAIAVCYRWGEKPFFS